MKHPDLQDIHKALDFMNEDLGEDIEDATPKVKAAVDWIIKNKGRYDVILHEFSFSETHPGGDTVVAIVESVLSSQRKGFKVETHYGPQTEVLIIGFKGAK